MILEVRELSFSYGKSEALKNVSLGLSAGEILCVMGPNGSGKSTLIDSIMGIHKPASGSILLSGRELRSYSRQELARQASYVPQNHSVTFPYTVREAVMMGRTAYVSAFGEPPESDGVFAEDAMKRVGISELADKSYGGISGGELRLVLLARALCQGSPLMLMDEPTAHLDYRNELRFLETVRSLAIEDGKAVLISTHSPVHAFYFASRGVPTGAIFLKKGAVAARGEPDDIITAELLEEVYGVRARILESDGEKTVLLQNSL
ncbi:MAG: ABC transporter ATP-binding protein [Oscillospiraceae bacterium]|nr:ABC transporter ATP-binding protein [Oscillospiraceae bacterium]